MKLLQIKYLIIKKLQNRNLRMDGVILTPLKISNIKGDIQHIAKASDPGYVGFGEAYMSSINKGAIKGWKKHNKMTLNLIVIIGR